MLYSKKIIAVLKASLLVLSVSIVPNTYAGLISLSSDYIVNVSLDGDHNSAGTVNGLVGNEVIARERLVQSQEDMRIASFIQFEMAGLSANSASLVDNIKDGDFGTYSLDVTAIVRSWVSGTSVNNGFVVYGAAPVFQGAGFNNISLEVTTPTLSAVTVSEPTTLVIFGLGMIALASRRFKKQF